MYKLIGSAKSRAFRVMWMLEELGEPYEHDAVDPRSPEALAVNPSAKVPAFLDGKDLIIDSVRSASIWQTNTANSPTRQAPSRVQAGQFHPPGAG